MRMLLTLPLLAGCVAADRALVDVPVVAATLASVEAESDEVVLVLTEARVTIADLRLESPAATARGWSFSPVAVAHAHPGHDFAGDVGGELLGTFTIDLLGEPVELGSASCYAGTYATGRLALVAEPALVLAGDALVEGEPRAFRFELAVDREITGVPFDAVVAAEDPPEQLVLSFDVANALSSVDWATPDDDGDGVLTLQDGQLGNTVPFGVTSTPTWNLSLEE